MRIYFDNYVLRLFILLFFDEKRILKYFLFISQVATCNCDNTGLLLF